MEKEIIEKIKDKRPNLKDNSLHNYLVNLRMLNNNEEIKDLKFLDDFDKVKDKLKDLKLTTKKNRVTAVIVILMAFNKKEEDILDYRILLDELQDEYNKKINNNEKTEDQKQNWISLKKLNKIIKDHEQEIKDRNLKDKKILKPKERDLVQQTLLSQLYLLIPPKRLDYNVKIVKDDKDVKDKDNYLINKSKNEKYFLIQDYKNVKSLGTQEVHLPRRINNLINLWLKFNDTEFLFLNNRNGRMSSNGLGKLLTKSFNKTGKHITINLIRKIYVSENLDMNAIKQSKQLAEDMSHSQKVQQSVYYKKE